MQSVCMVTEVTADKYGAGLK